MSESVTAKSVVRLGRIDYVNTLPFFHSLENRDGSFQFLRGHPVEINGMIQSGRIDAGLISSLAYAQLWRSLLILPGFCIGSRERIQSVVLLSHVKIDSLKGKKIVTSSRSFSGSALLKILLRLRWGFENEFESSDLGPEEMLSHSNACLVIGDEALSFQPTDELHVYDLGWLWWQWTKTPFCFALWTVRRDFYREHAEEAEDLYRVLNQTLKENLENLDAVAGSGSETKILKREPHGIRDYLSQLEYHFTSEVRKGLLLFYRYAMELGLISEMPVLEFMPLNRQGRA